MKTWAMLIITMTLAMAPKLQLPLASCRHALDQKLDLPDTAPLAALTE